MFKDVHVAMYFSNIVFVLNCFQITPFVNTALYLGNIGALLGIILLLSMNPAFPYVNFETWMPVSNGEFNVILVAMHVFPVYVFRERQSMLETFAPKTIAAISAAFLVYLFVVKREIPRLYGVLVEILAKMAFFIFLLFLGFGAILFWKQPV